MPVESPQDIVKNTHNTSRFFVEHSAMSWVALGILLLFGAYGYLHMPQRKDPKITVRVVVAACQWPGATTAQVEQLITKPIERTVAENQTIHPPTAADYGIRSITLPGASFVYVQLAEDVTDSRKQYSDINLRLEQLQSQLPQGAGPIQFQSDFGDTAALMLTIASPRVDANEIDVRSAAIQNTLQSVRDSRAQVRSQEGQAESLVTSFPAALSSERIKAVVQLYAEDAAARGMLSHPIVSAGSGFVALDAISKRSETELNGDFSSFIGNRLPSYQLDPDIWQPIVIHDLRSVQPGLVQVAGAKYSYAQLDDFTEILERSLRGVKEASRVERKGVLDQNIYLEYSQDRMAAYNVKLTDVIQALQARNITAPSGTISDASKELQVNTTGIYKAVDEIGATLVPTQQTESKQGQPVYLRDLATVSRSYESPAQYLNYYTWFHDGNWERSRAISLAVFMRDKEFIAKFGKSATDALEKTQQILPADLIIARTSDQPLQVRQNISQFTRALEEAVVLVVLIALIGFWEWRSAMLMAVSIPITLALTFGLCFMVRIDLQQVSIATLIIALGLLIDNPVVANDAIKQNMAAGLSTQDASWVGPTRLSKAILFATLTNIVAYIPFLLVTGNTGDFLYSLPIVMTAALVSSRVVAMTFVPLLARYLLKPAKKPELSAEEKRSKGFYGKYFRFSQKAIEHRWGVLGISGIFIVGGGIAASFLKTEFFPLDLQYWSYVDIWLPNGTPAGKTDQVVKQAEDLTRQVVDDYERREKPKLYKGPRFSGHLLQSITSFVGGGSSRFWVSFTPEQQQTNYGLLLVQLNSKEATPKFIAALQPVVSKAIPGAQVICHQLQVNPVEFPIDLRLESHALVDTVHGAEDMEALRGLSHQLQQLLEEAVGVAVVVNDSLGETLLTNLIVDSDRANLSGISNQDVALSAQGALRGIQITTLREGDKQIPVVGRLNLEERAKFQDLEGLYVYSSQAAARLPLLSVASLNSSLQQERIRHQEQFRSIGLHAYTNAGVLSSDVLKQITPRLKTFQASLPPGFRLTIGGEQAKQDEGFRQLSASLAISVLLIYIVLVLQFKHVIKPFIVFAATPYGVMGAVLALTITHIPFGFMAFLGVASLIGVIISHIIVLFDFIEEKHEAGEPLEQALGDAGVARIRPILITVFATVLALFPLALEGGPLWKPLCYAQIGGLSVATFITLILVPVIYSIFVKDFKIVEWDSPKPE